MVAASAAAPGPIQKNEKSETPETGDVLPWEKYKTVVDHVMRELMTHKDLVIDASVVEEARGWTVTAYVKTRKQQFQLCRESLMEMAQQALVDAVERSEQLIACGHWTLPPAPTRFGFGCVLTAMAEPDNACWGTHSKGFCRLPGSCKFQHPPDHVGVQVMFNPARRRQE